MWKELAKKAGAGSSKPAVKAAEKKPAKSVVCGSPDHEREDCPVWPPGIGESLSVDSENGGGLHNLSLQIVS